ncbi:MAG: hydantoinase/oxoprolinase family protein [Candidatus Hodarchaeales archaeon]|jgi:N-methylhydantoinase A
MSGIIGIDVGGTFSDLTYLSPSGQITVLKVPSTPQDQSIGVQNSINQLQSELGQKNVKFDFLVHGSTVATNTVLTRTGSKTALITTHGFKDIIEIGRQTRTSLYDLDVDPVKPLVPRHLRFEVFERLDSAGKIIEPLNMDNVNEIIQKIPEEIESVAISFLFSFLNSDHEKLVEKAIKGQRPKILLSRSSKVLPVFREFERTSTTILDAYIKPVMYNYLRRLKERVEKATGNPVEGLRVMKGDSGLVTIPQATERAAETILSGLAGGVLGGVLLHRILTEKSSETPVIRLTRLVSLDIGGTSTDVSLIQNGKPMFTRDGKIGDLPLAIPSVDVVTVGAGGGSIAHVARSGLFQVGPRSAGADPGPACYGLGGTEPTVTDADLLAGKLNSANFCGGKMSLYPDLSQKAISSLAEELRLSEDKCIIGITRIADTNVVAAVRKVSLERGHDPRQCTLAAFGGAGPTHACNVATLAGINVVVVPPFPGVWSAVGLLTADHKRTEMKSILVTTEEFTLSDLHSELNSLKASVRDFLETEGFSHSQIQFSRELDCRFEGQAYELVVPISPQVLAEDSSEDIIRKLFEQEHQRIYDFIAQESRVEIVNIRVIGTCERPPSSFEGPEKGNKNPIEAILDQREVLFTKWIETDVFLRNRLASGNQITGPAIIEQSDSTTVVPPGWTAMCDSSGCLILKTQ